jgi:NAD(P)-dependent dehydrogenase (short-subunit alcohol dehydrogenase family)
VVGSRRLDRRVALITGAAMGMGAAHARQFAAEGAEVLLADVADEPGEALAAEMREAGQSASYARLDVTDSAQGAGVVAGLPALHILMNNAAVSDSSGLLEMTDEAWDRTISVNQRGVFLGMRECIPVIARSGGGAVINVSSVFGLRSSLRHLAYHASKAAVVLMTRSAAAAHGRDGVRVNAICPGLVRAPLLAAEDEEAVEAMARNLPLGWIAEPEEIARAVAFLASDDASFVTGSELVIDGGQLTY